MSPTHTHPDKLSFTYGDWERPVHCEWGEDALDCGSLLNWDNQTIKVQPSPAEWHRFWIAVEEAKVWSWRGEYNNDQVLDGIQWSLEMQHAGRRIKCEGINAFPGWEATPEFPETCEFAKFLTAIERLTRLKFG